MNHLYTQVSWRLCSLPGASEICPETQSIQTNFKVKLKPTRLLKSYSKNNPWHKPHDQMNAWTWMLIVCSQSISICKPSRCSHQQNLNKETPPTKCNYTVQTWSYLQYKLVHMKFEHKRKIVVLAVAALQWNMQRITWNVGRNSSRDETQTKRSWTKANVPGDAREQRKTKAGFAACYFAGILTQRRFSSTLPGCLKRRLMAYSEQDMAKLSFRQVIMILRCQLDTWTHHRQLAGPRALSLGGIGWEDHLLQSPAIAILTGRRSPQRSLE